LSPQFSLRQHATAFTLGLILLLAAFIRLYHLGHQSLWVDEIASMNGAAPQQTWAQVIAYSVSDQPPAFFLLLHGWLKIFAYSDVSGRALGVVIGLAGIIAMFFLGKELKDTSTGLTASAITTFSYIHILFSQEIRFYTLVFFFATLSYLFFIRAVRMHTPANFIFYSLFTAALIYTHYFGAVVFASQGILFLLLVALYRASRQFIVSSVAAAVLVLIIVSPWIPVLFADANMEEFWIQHESFLFPIKYFYVYFKDVTAAIVFALMIFFYLADRFRRYKAARHIDQADFILLGGITLSFLLPLIYSFVNIPLLHVRYSIIALPLIIVVISLGFSLLKPSFRKTLLPFVCITSLLSLVLIEKFYEKPQKEDWRGITKKIATEATADDVVVSPEAWYCNYYFGQLHFSAGSILPSQLDLQSKKPAGIFWIRGFQEAGSMDTDEVNLIQNGYTRVRTDSLFKVRASYYRLQ
jgi:mannosyltransferase